MSGTAVVTTPMASNANSYISVEDADQYFEDRLVSAAATAWGAADADHKRRALLQATRELDAYLVWQGIATTASQALAFPRIGLVDPDTNTYISDTLIPRRLAQATAEQAAADLVTDRSVELPQVVQGLRRLVAGPVELEFKDNVQAARPIVCAIAIQLVGCWGRQAQPGLGGAIPLVRA